MEEGEIPKEPLIGDKSASGECKAGDNILFPVRGEMTETPFGFFVLSVACW